MNGALRLQITKAKLISESYPPQTISPFFIASVSPYKIFRSNVRNNEGKQPTWNEECQFQINNGESELLIVVYSGQIELGRTSLNIFNQIMPLGNSFSETEIPLFNFGAPAGCLLLKACFSNSSNVYDPYGANANCPQIDSRFSNAFTDHQNKADYPSFDDIIDSKNNNNFNNNNNTNQMNFNNFNNNNSNNNFNLNSNNNNSFNNINNNNPNFINQQQPQQLWQQWLNYNKTPIFLKSRTSEVYLANLDTKEFKLLDGVNFNFPLYSSKCELPDGSIFVTGGDNIGDTINTCFTYSQNKVITYKRNMNVARKLHSSVYMDGFVYVFGGFDGVDIKNYCEKYDVKNDLWVNISPMAMNRAYTSLLRYGNEFIFVIGGANGMGDEGFIETNTIERYDVKNNRFDIFQICMPEALYGVSSFLVSNSKILIFGGFNTVKGNNHKIFTIDLSNGAINYLKNIENDLWTTLGAFYYKNSICVISTGEEVDEDMPYVFQFPIQLPLN